MAAVVVASLAGVESDTATVVVASLGAYRQRLQCVGATDLRRTAGEHERHREGRQGRSHRHHVPRRFPDKPTRSARTTGGAPSRLRADLLRARSAATWVIVAGGRTPAAECHSPAFVAPEALTVSETVAAIPETIRQLDSAVRGGASASEAKPAAAPAVIAASRDVLGEVANLERRILKFDDGDVRELRQMGTPQGPRRDHREGGRGRDQRCQPRRRGRG